MLSNQIRYATRGLVYLAMHYGGSPVPLREIAAFGKIPEKYLETIFSVLRRGHLVESVKGKHGGYLLLSSPERTTLLDVIRVFDPALVTGELPDGDPDYALWKDIEDVLIDKLSALSLSGILDLLRSKDKTLHYAI